MPAFAIVETPNGYTIVEQPENVVSEEDAVRQFGGLVVDPGPYRSYEDACDALLALQQEAADEAEAGMGE